MRGNLSGRLARLVERDPATAGRMIVLGIEAERAGDTDLAQATLAGAGIERGTNDLLVLIKRYGGAVADAGCTLLSVTPLAPSRGRTSR